MVKYTYDSLKDNSINSKLVYYLMSSYLYYEVFVNVFTDGEFNLLCKELLDNFDSITHKHKKLVDKDSLSASTGYTIKYPLIVKHAADSWYKEYLVKKLRKEI